MTRDEYERLTATLLDAAVDIERVSAITEMEPTQRASIEKAVSALRKIVYHLDLEYRT